MTKKDSTVKIKDGEVVFSQEILTYFENIRTEENSKWIDKYFEVLNDKNNINSKKYNQHHIRPCFTFKDKEHKNRKQTEKLGNEFNGNIIKLSIYNHLFAHFYLWKIFDDKDSKTAFQHMCNQGKYIDNLTENELKEIAILKENCSKENLTEEEIKEHNKNAVKKYMRSEKGKNKMQKYRNENQYKLSEYGKNWYLENKDDIKEKRKRHYKENHIKIYQRKKNYRKNNHDKILEQDRKYREKNHDRLSKKQKEYDNQECYDPIANNKCTLCALRGRKQRNKEKYKDIIPMEYIIK